jgi:hypothetical protein
MTSRLARLLQFLEIAAMWKPLMSLLNVPRCLSIKTWGTFEEFRFSAGTLAPVTQHMRSCDVGVEHADRFFGEDLRSISLAGAVAKLLGGLKIS